MPTYAWKCSLLGYTLLCTYHSTMTHESVGYLYMYYVTSSTPQCY